MSHEPRSLRIGIPRPYERACISLGLKIRRGHYNRCAGCRRGRKNGLTWRTYSSTSSGVSSGIMGRFLLHRLLYFEGSGEWWTLFDEGMNPVINIITLKKMWLQRGKYINITAKPDHYVQPRPLRRLRRGWGMIPIGVGFSMQGVVRQGRVVIPPVLLGPNTIYYQYKIVVLKIEGWLHTKTKLSSFGSLSPGPTGAVSRLK